MDPFEQSTGHLVDSKKVQRAVFVYELRRALVIVANLALFFGAIYLLSGNALFTGAIAWTCLWIIVGRWVAWRYSSDAKHLSRHPAIGLTRVDMSAPRHQDVARMWEKKCRAHGFSSAGVFRSAEYEDNFGVMGVKGTADLALVIPYRSTLARYIDAEIDTILEHEIAHRRMTNQFLHLCQYYFCVSGDFVFSLCRMSRSFFLGMHLWFASRLAHRLECAAFRLTRISVMREEEHVADALAAEASGTPYPLISAFIMGSRSATQPLLGDGHDDNGESEFVFAIIERSTQQISIAEVIGQSYDAKFRSHPSDKKRCKKLLALRK